MDYLIISLIVNFIITTFIAYWSERVQLDFWTVWLISFFLSPIVGMFYVVLNKKELIETKTWTKELTPKELIPHDKWFDAWIFVTSIVLVILFVYLRLFIFI